MSTTTSEQTDSTITPFLKAASLLEQGILSDVTRATGLSGSWFECLLWISRGPGGCGRMCDVAESIGMLPSSFTRLVDRMEDGGLVMREIAAADRRTTMLRLTSLGEARLAEALTVHGPSVARRFADLVTAEELAVLRSVSIRLEAANRNEQNSEAAPV